MSEIRDKAAEEYALEHYRNFNEYGEPILNTLAIRYFQKGYNYAKRNDPDVKALFDVLDHAMEIGYFNGFGSTEMMAKDAIKNYRKAIEGEK